MPIRTNRGRAAVYRRLWGWPLRSPKHLVVTLIGVVVLAIVIGIIAARVHGTTRPTPTGSAALGSTTNGQPTTNNVGTTGNGTTTSTAPPVSRLSGPPESPVSAPPAPAALTLITTWGKLWVNHPAGMTTPQWQQQLAQYTTPELLPQMGSVDLANINATEVTGAPVVTKSSIKSVEALLPTNAGQLDITAVENPQGWLVAAYNPVSG